eukprot:scaffold1497_cov85-Skeletonema_dohrnii-CCMP3373.AAC.4
MSLRSILLLIVGVIRHNKITRGGEMMVEIDLLAIMVVVVADDMGTMIVLECRRAIATVILRKDMTTLNIPRVSPGWQHLVVLLLAERVIRTLTPIIQPRLPEGTGILNCILSRRMKLLQLQQLLSIQQSSLNQHRLRDDGLTRIAVMMKI